MSAADIRRLERVLEALHARIVALELVLGGIMERQESQVRQAVRRALEVPAAIAPEVRP